MTEPQSLPSNLRASSRNAKVGEVVSTKMAKTVVVEVVLQKAHQLYRRGIKSHRRFYAHDEAGSARLGDIVKIVETRPLSKLKRWRLVEVVRAASLAPSSAEIAQAVGEGEIARDTRKPKPAAAAAPEPAPKKVEAK